MALPECQQTVRLGVFPQRTDKRAPGGRKIYPFVLTALFKGLPLIGIKCYFNLIRGVRRNDRKRRPSRDSPERPSERVEQLLYGPSMPAADSRPGPHVFLKELPSLKLWIKENEFESVDLPLGNAGTYQ